MSALKIAYLETWQYDIENSGHTEMEQVSCMPYYFEHHTEIKLAEISELPIDPDNLRSSLEYVAAATLEEIAHVIAVTEFEENEEDLDKFSFEYFGRYEDQNRRQ